MNISRVTFLLLFSTVLPACSTWSGNSAPFGEAVRNMHATQAVSPVGKAPKGPPLTDGQKVREAVDKYHGKGADGVVTGGIGLNP